MINRYLPITYYTYQVLLLDPEIQGKHRRSFTAVKTHNKHLTNQ